MLLYHCHPGNIVFFCGRRLHRSRPKIPGMLWRDRKVPRHVAVRVTPTLLITIRRTFSNTVSLCRFVQIRASLSASASSSEAPICLCGDSLPCQVGVCQWKPFWTPVEDSFKKGLCGRMGLHQR